MGLNCVVCTCNVFWFLGNQSRVPQRVRVSSAIGCAAASVWSLGCDNFFFFFCSSSSTFLFASISGPCTHSRSPPKCRRLGIRQGGGGRVNELAPYRASFPGITNYQVTASPHHPPPPSCPGVAQSCRLGWARPLLCAWVRLGFRTPHSILHCRPVGFQGKCSSHTHPPPKKQKRRKRRTLFSLVGVGFMAGACMRADGGYN